MRSPPWFCLNFSFFLPGSSQARSSRLSGNLPCDIWLPVLRQKVKQGGVRVHISWKCRKTAACTTSSSSTSSASLRLMPPALAAAPVRQPRTHTWRARRSARLPGGQSSRTAKPLRTGRFSPGWRSPDTQMRKAAAGSQVCVTWRAKGPFFIFWNTPPHPPKRDFTLYFILKDDKFGCLATRPITEK